MFSMFEVALPSWLTLRRPTPQPPQKYVQPGRQVSVRVREVNAAPRCACQPRTAGSAFERLGLERARSREARRPHRAVCVDVHHPATQRFEVPDSWMPILFRGRAT